MLNSSNLLEYSQLFLEEENEFLSVVLKFKQEGKRNLAKIQSTEKDCVVGRRIGIEYLACFLLYRYKMRIEI